MQPISRTASDLAKVVLIYGPLVVSLGSVIGALVLSFMNG